MVRRDEMKPTISTDSRFGTTIGRRIRRLGLGLAAGVVGINPVAAQDISVPSRVEASTVSDQRERAERERPDQPSLLQDIDVNDLVGGEAARMAFTPRSLDLEGPTVFPAAELRAPLEALLGREVTLAQTLAAARTIAAKYEKAGYLLTKVVLPVQDLSTGALKVRVTEFTARRVEVRVDGRPVEPSPAIRQALDKLARSTPLKGSDYLAVERELDAAPDLKLVRVRPAHSGEKRLDGVIEYLRRVPNADKAVVVRASADPRKPPANAESAHFVLRDVAIEGSTVYGAEGLRSLYADLIGKDVTLARVYEITKAIEKKYADDDYLYTSAVLPPQYVVDGRVKLFVDEYRVDKIRVVVDGREAAPNSRIASIAGKIPNLGVIKRAEVDHYLQILADLPGIKPVEVRPPEGPGEPETIFAKRKRVEGSLAVDNRGDRTVGKLEYSGTLAINSPLGIEDRLDLEVGAGDAFDEAVLGTVKYAFPLNDEGTRATLSVSHTRVKPGSELRELGMRSFGTTYRAEITHPVIRQVATTLRAFVLFDRSDNDTSIYDGDYVTDRSRTRSLSGGVKYRGRDSWFGARGTNRANLALTRGLDVMNASEGAATNVSRRGFDPTFTKLVLEASREQRLPAGFTLNLATKAQWGFDVLPSSQMLSFGGTDFGRGHSSGIIRGDSGIIGKLELSYDVEVGLPYFQGVQFYSFYDVGWTDRKATARKVGGRRSSATAGGGARFMLTDSLNAEFEAAKPLTIDEETTNGVKHKDPIFSFKLEYQF